MQDRTVKPVLIILPLLRVRLVPKEPVRGGPGPGAGVAMCIHPVSGLHEARPGASEGPQTGARQGG